MTELSYQSALTSGEVSDHGDHRDTAGVTTLRVISDAQCVTVSRPRIVLLLFLLLIGQQCRFEDKLLII